MPYTLELNRELSKPFSNHLIGFEKLLPVSEHRPGAETHAGEPADPLEALARLLFLHLEIIFHAMKKYHLGEFEEIVLLTVAILHSDAYGVSIKEEIESRLDRDVSLGALHAALVRLEDKGYVRSFNGEVTEERAGRPRRYFQITALGRKAMAYSRDTREQLWKAIPKLSIVGLGDDGPL